MDKLAWLAGLWEGEGCASAENPLQRGRRYGPYLRLTLGMVDEDVVRAAQSVAGVGIVKLRPRANPRWQPVWLWVTGNQGDATALLLRLYPYLGERRREKARGLLTSRQKYEVVEIPDLPPWTPDSSEEGLSWLAGLFEGEGCIGMSNANGYGPYVRLAVDSSDRDVLELAQEIAGGVGRITEATRREESPRWKTRWKWRVSDQAQAKALLTDMLPMLGLRRSERAREALASQPTRPEGVSAQLKVAKEHHDAIRERCLAGERTNALAAEFGVSRTTIYNIAHRKDCYAP